jgi:hypothetical protein
MGSSLIFMMCSRLKKAAITMDIPTDVDSKSGSPGLYRRCTSGFPTVQSGCQCVCHYIDSQAATGGTCQALARCGPSCCILCAVLGSEVVILCVNDSHSTVSTPFWSPPPLLFDMLGSLVHPIAYFPVYPKADLVVTPHMLVRSYAPNSQS